MKIQTSLKALAVLGATALTLAAPAHADDDYDNGYYGNGNAYGYSYGNSYGNPYANPWLANQAQQQARQQAEHRNRIAQLEQRQEVQLKRILDGMETGRLTNREAAALLREHLAISALERKYLADGRLGPKELRELEARLEEANRRITFENRDRERERNPQRDYDWERDRDPDRRPGAPIGQPGDWGRR